MSRSTSIFGALRIAAVLLVAGMAQFAGAQDAQSVVVPATTNLVEQQAALETRMREVELEVVKVMRTSREVRARVVSQDQEIGAAKLQIATLQAKIEKIISEKYPELAGMQTKQSELSREHAEIRRRLAELRAMKKPLSLKEDSNQVNQR